MKPYLKSSHHIIAKPKLIRRLPRRLLLVDSSIDKCKKEKTARDPNLLHEAYSLDSL
jgi:hypothetical protein